MRIRKLAPVEWLHPGSCVIRSPSRVACLASVVLALCCMPAIAGCNLQVIAELPVTLLGLHPLITVQINRSGIPVVLDSGAMFNLLSYDTTAKLRLRLHSLRGHPTVSGISGLGDTLLALAVVDVRLGAARITGAEFIVADARIGGPTWSLQIFCAPLPNLYRPKFDWT